DEYGNRGKRRRESRSRNATRHVSDRQPTARLARDAPQRGEPGAGRKTDAGTDREATWSLHANCRSMGRQRLPASPPRSARPLLVLAVLAFGGNAFQGAALELVRDQVARVDRE